MKLTSPMIDEILRRVETGETTIADANALRAYIRSLLMCCDDDGVFERDEE